MITRQDYLNNKATFEEYYGQFISPSTGVYVARSVGVDKLLKSKDKHLNDIPLSIWDGFIGYFNGNFTFQRLKEAGDVNALSQANACCLSKEAARLWLADHPIEEIKHYEGLFRCFVFTDEKKTNAFLERYEGFGVLKEQDGKIYVASLKDKGDGK